MEMDSKQIEVLVKQVLAQMTSPEGAAASVGAGTGGAVPSTAKIAVLTGAQKIEVKEVPMDSVGDEDILVRVEGCGICGTDVHEWRKDPFGLIPVVLGHEGTGEIIAMGSKVKTDTAGNPVKLGDRIVTSIVTCGECGSCRLHPDQPQLCENAKVYGLIGDNDPGHRLNGWFASHILIKGGSTFFQVNDLSLDQRMLLELAAVAVHAVERANSTRLLNFNSKVLIQGCGPVGLMTVAVLKAFGVNHIIALDGNEGRLSMAKRLGALSTINFKELTTLESRVQAVKNLTNGAGADFAFQCTGAPAAAADVYKYIRRGGGLCEMGFFVNNGECTINPHFDLCNKEITLVGSWTYGPHEYPLTIAFLRQAKEIGLPLEELITHRSPLCQLNEAMETNVAQKGIKIAYVAQ